MSLTPDSLLNSNTELVSLPEIVFQLNEMVNDSNCSAADIGEVINKDAGLTMRLLKIVNSPFYGFPSSIETISMAITVMGIRQLRDLVFSTCVISKYSKIPSDILNPDSFWSHSIATATTAQLIAKKVNLSNSEYLFTCGILHDIGLLIMALAAPATTRQVLELSKDSNKPSHDLQLNVFGFSQGELAAALIRKWRLPDSFIEPIELQQTNKVATHYPMETAILKVANVISNMQENTALTGDNQLIHPGTLELLGLHKDDLNEISDETQAKLQAMLSVLYTRQAA